jgi:DNA-directed RNA polymerase II subunit RPB2
MASKDNNLMTTDEIMKLADLIFSQEYKLFEYLYNSYDIFIDQTLKNFLENQKHIISTTEDSVNIYVNYIIFSKLLIEEPYNENTNERIYPMLARQNNLTYQIRVFANATQYQDVLNIQTQNKTTRQIGETTNKMLISTIPLMVRSKRCTLNVDRNTNKTECKYDPGGYFIIKGSEKVVINQDTRAPNKPIVTYDKIGGVQSLVAKVSSKTYTPSCISQIISIVYENNDDITLNIPILNKVNVVVIFKVLGLIKDKDIINSIVYDKTNTAMMNLVIKCIQNCVNEKGKKINTQEEALDFLLLKTKVPKKITDENPEIKLRQQKQHLMQLLEQNLYPHIQGNKIKKAIYMGYVIRKLLLVKLKYLPLDEKDSYVNKRIDLPGELMFELFKQHFRKTIGECKKHFEAKNKKDDEPISIIQQYKSTIIEQGFKSAFAIGYWLKKQGVAQVLPRLSYPQMISSLRRIDTHIGDPKTNKISIPRYFHTSSQGFLCSLSTPEHAKIGLTKHLAMLASITIIIYEQYVFLREYLIGQCDDILDVPTEYLSNPEYVLAFLNGELIGCTNNHLKIRDHINNMRWKTKELSNKYVSVVYDVDNAELRIYCDSGRLFRPIIRVDDNESKLKRDHVKNISLNHMDNLKGKITTMAEFEDKYNDVIEYIDSELQPYVLLAGKQEDVVAMKHRMDESLKNDIREETNKIANRYDKSFFIKYNYHEIHPSLLLGEIVGNVPYSNHIYGVRMTLHYAQGKQASGIYSTKYKERLDISSILYNPQKPLISTRACKYTNYNTLPTGENVIIAIMSYTGYNQEDGIVFNKDSIERGKFMTDIYKKHEIEGMKSHSSGSMDVFTKPDQTLVIAKNVSYSKLNNEGYCPVGTILEKGDVIFGKVTPITGIENERSSKKFRDTSEVYNSTSSGVVVKNYIDITDETGNTIRRALVSSQRPTCIGDKYCCYDDQTEILTTDGWLFFKDLTIKHKVACMINDTLYYKNPDKVVNYDCNDQLYYIKSGQVELCVTKNHRMYISKNRCINKKYTIELAENILNKRVYFKKNIDKIDCDMNHPNISKCGKYFVLPALKDLPEKYLDLEAFIEFYGIFIAEGFVKRAHEKTQCVVIAAHKQRIKDKLIVLSEKLNLRYTMNKDHKEYEDRNIWNYWDKQLIFYFNPLSVGAVNKKLEDWTWHLSQNLCRIMLNALICGDGHYHKNTVTMKYDTSSKQLSDDVQQLCLHCGYSANRYIREQSIDGTTIKSGIFKGTIIRPTTTAYRLTIVQRQNQPKINKTKLQDKLIDYNGKVYCCTMNKSDGDGIIYVRRNGIPVWSCNSRYGKALYCLKTLKLQKDATSIV